MSFDYMPHLTRLKAAGFSVEAKNGGHHLIVRFRARTIDFWPASGKWADRSTGAMNRGIDELIAEFVPMPTVRRASKEQSTEE